MKNAARQQSLYLAFCFCCILLNWDHFFHQTRKCSDSISMRAGIGKYDQTATTGTTQQRSEPCFLTMQMAANGNFLEPIQDIDKIGIRLPGYRYIVMTNDERLDTKGWEKVVIDLGTHRYTRVKTHVSYAKFMAWRHPALDTCRVVFVMDALNVPVDNATIWEQLERQVQASPAGLLAQIKPNNNTNMGMLQMLPKMHKESRPMVDRTAEWLTSRPDYRDDTLVLWTNFFGYDPANTLYQQASSEFWDLYSTEMLTARDQPLWSYIIQDRWKLQPTYFQATESSPRPHVHACLAQKRLLCESGDPSISREKCQKDKESWSLHHRLVGVRDPKLFHCEPRRGSHKMSVLNTF